MLCCSTNPSEGLSVRHLTKQFKQRVLKEQKIFISWAMWAKAVQSLKRPAGIVTAHTSPGFSMLSKLGVD